MEALWIQAEEAIRRGEAYDKQEKPELAEQQYRKALALYDRLLGETGEKTYARAAEEACTTLADLCMQMGNLHGADVYYVKALGYGSQAE